MTFSPRIRRDADVLLEALASERVAPLAPDQAAAMRARVIARMEDRRDRLADRRLRLARWGRAAVFVAAACLPLAMAGAARLPLWPWARVAQDGVVVTAVAGSSEIERGGAARPLSVSSPAPLQESDELSTGQDGVARASLPTGAVVQVGPQSTLRLAKAGERRRGPVRDRVELLRGKIDVQVPRLLGGDELSVDSAGITVVVHGTRFSMERTAWAGRAEETRIDVMEGKVAVYFGHGERLLLAGESLVLPAERSSASGDRSPAEDVSADAAGRGAMPIESTLGAENALLSSAMRSRRDGDRAGALTTLDELLGRYPRSPLAETARVEKLRVLFDMASFGPAAREAERYLADYPRGFARDEAIRILARARSHTR